MKNKKNKRGGPRPGSGPKKRPEGETKEQISVSIYRKKSEKKALLTEKKPEFNELKVSICQQLNEGIDNILKIN